VLCRGRDFQHSSNASEREASGNDSSFGTLRHIFAKNGNLSSKERTVDWTQLCFLQNVCSAEKQCSCLRLPSFVCSALIRDELCSSIRGRRLPMVIMNENRSRLFHLGQDGRRTHGHDGHVGLTRRGLGCLQSGPTLSGVGETDRPGRIGQYCPNQQNETRVQTFGTTRSVSQFANKTNLIVLTSVRKPGLGEARSGSIQVEIA
jgi:hypothetical protein